MSEAFLSEGKRCHGGVFHPAACLFLQRYLSIAKDIYLFQTTCEVDNSFPGNFHCKEH